MKKSLLLAACLAVVALAACNKASDEAAAPASDASAASAPAAAASDAGAAASDAAAAASDAGAAAGDAALAASDLATAVASAAAVASSQIADLSSNLASNAAAHFAFNPAVVAGPASVSGAPASSAAAAEPPAVAPTPPPSAFASVNEAIADMISGHLVFNVPTPVDIDETCPCRIDAVLSATQSVPDLQKLITNNNPQATNVQSAQVQMSNQMIARLTADPDDFTIDPKGDQEQAVSSQQPTTWTWTVTPNRWGHHTLQLVIEAVVTIQGHDQPMLLKTFDKPIQVTVTPWGRIRRFAAENWKWAWTAILVPIAGWIWSSLKRRFA